MMQGKGASIINFVNIPVSIILGMGIGILAGYLHAMYLKNTYRDTVKVLLILSISFILVATVNINYLGNMGIKALIVIFGALIVITAPLGTFAIDLSYKKLLRRNE